MTRFSVQKLLDMLEQVFEPAEEIDLLVQEESGPLRKVVKLEDGGGAFILVIEDPETPSVAPGLAPYVLTSADPIENENAGQPTLFEAAGRPEDDPAKENW